MGNDTVTRRQIMRVTERKSRRRTHTRPAARKTGPECKNPRRQYRLSLRSAIVKSLYTAACRGSPICQGCLARSPGGLLTHAGSLSPRNSKVISARRPGEARRRALSRFHEESGRRKSGCRAGRVSLNPRRLMQARRGRRTMRESARCTGGLLSRRERADSGVARAPA